MTTVHAEVIGDKALLPRKDLDRLLELARRVEPIQIALDESSGLARGIMELAEKGGSFDWLADEPDLYTVEDLKVRYR